MKKICPLLTAFFILLIYSCAPKCATCPMHSGGGLRYESDEISSFKSSGGWHKLDGRFKQAWIEKMQKGESLYKFECLLKTNAKLNTADKKTLANTNFLQRSTIEKITTGAVAAKDVPKVALLAFVEAMELAVPVSPK